MTAVARSSTASFFEDAFERISAFARDYHARRAQRIALLALMDMDASRLDDLGLNPQDVVDALGAPPPAARVLESRRSQRSGAWTPSSPLNA